MITKHIASATAALALATAALVSCQSTDDTIVRNPNGTSEGYGTLRRLEGGIPPHRTIEFNQGLIAGSTYLVTATQPVATSGINYKVYSPNGSLLTSQSESPARFLTKATGCHRVVVTFPSGTVGRCYSVKIGQRVL